MKQKKKESILIKSSIKRKKLLTAAKNPKRKVQKI